jgi:hypothetical protein
MNVTDAVSSECSRLPDCSSSRSCSVPLSNPRQVHTLLDRAKSRRAVAATLMNERSSRSHSVFTLKVRGVNPLTDERCEAMLNLGQFRPPVPDETLTRLQSTWLDQRG